MIRASSFSASPQTLMCVKIHEMVAMKCEQYLAELSRYNYVTPKSYLELLKIFSDLIGRKKQELCGARLRMKTGLDKARRTPRPLALSPSRPLALPLRSVSSVSHLPSWLSAAAEHGRERDQDAGRDRAHEASLGEGVPRGCGDYGHHSSRKNQPVYNLP